jgi:hypothetical protein
MANIKIKRGDGIPSGLTFGELAFDATNKRLYIGITGGNALLANTDGGVASFNGLTGAVTGVTLGGTNVFTALNSFNAGISASNITTDYLVVAGGSTFGAAVDHVFGLSNRGLKINAGKGSSEILSYGNEALSINAMGGNSTLELYGRYVAVGDDGNNDGTQIVVDDNTATIVLYGAGETKIQTSGGLGLYNEFSLKFYDIQDPAGYVAFKAPSIANDITWTLPGSDGSANQVLTTNGSGILSWSTPSGSGGVSSITAGTGISVSSATGAVTITNTGVRSFNGLTGAVSGVTTSTANTFTALQTFSNGINASGATLSGTVSISGLSNPTTDSQAANKAYVDLVATTGVHYHDPVLLASTDAETFATGVTYNNGTSGVGATLTKTASFARINIDSTNGSTGDRILIRSATTQQWNGIYTVTDIGSGAAGWILTRATDANEYHPFSNTGLGANDYFFVTSGASLKNDAFVLNTFGGITFGTTPIAFSLFSQTPEYTAGTGLALTGLQFTNTGVQSFNGFTGGVTLAVGSGITFTASSGTITLSTTGSGGGISRSITSITGSTTAGSASSTDYVYIGGSTLSINLTMPTAVSNTNRYTVKQSSTGTLTILTTSSQTIDGVTGFALNRQYQAVDLISNNANWIVV